jgi:hypothetical protein
MEGVTTAVVLFVFFCLAMPSIIKNRNQYYVAFFAIVAVIFLDAVAHMFPASAPAPRAVCYVLAAFGQIIAVVMMFMATGGLTFRALQGDIIEVMRRDGEKEVIVPLSDEAKQKIRANQEAAEKRVKADEEHKVYTIETPPGATPPLATPPAATPPGATPPGAAVPPKAVEHGPLPLE